MSKIVLDADLRAKLNGLNEQVELCDRDGATVGRFVPEAEYLRLFYASLKEQVSDEELAELRNQPGGRPLKEIWRSLGRS